MILQVTNSDGCSLRVGDQIYYDRDSSKKLYYIMKFEPYLHKDPKTGKQTQNYRIDCLDNDANVKVIGTIEHVVKTGKRSGTLLRLVRELHEEKN